MYGIDDGDRDQMRRMSWPVLKDRILGLLSYPVTYDVFGNPVFRSRLQAKFWTPPPPTTGRARRPR